MINGGIIHKKIRQELTYRDLDSRMDNLWSVLFTTGYLTQCGQEQEGKTGLVIPNREIQWIFVEQIQEIGIIIELKYAEKAAFEERCRKALKQIDDRNYEEVLTDDGMTIIRKYGIACYKKRCRVISG